MTFCPVIAPKRIPLAALALSAASTLAAPGQAQAKSGHANSGDLSIYYEIHGDLAPGVRPFLVLHGGLGMISSDFEHLLPLLAELGPVIGVEQQGHGHTGGRDAPISLEAMRADTLAVLDTLEVDQVHVIGFSMGGMLAVDLAVQAPERLATLTAISVSQNHESMIPSIVEMNLNPAATPSPEALELMPSEAEFAQMQAGFASNPDGPEQFERTFAQLMDFIVSDWGWSDAELASIQVPAMIVLGDNDFTPVDHAMHMATVMGAQLAVLPDTTHMSIMRRPDWLASLIENRIATGGG